MPDRSHSREAGQERLFPFFVAPGNPATRPPSNALFVGGAAFSRVRSHGCRSVAETLPRRPVCPATMAQGGTDEASFLQRPVYCSAETKVGESLALCHGSFPFPHRSLRHCLLPSPPTTSLLADSCREEAEGPGRGGAGCGMCARLSPKSLHTQLSGPPCVRKLMTARSRPTACPRGGQQHHSE